MTAPKFPPCPKCGRQNIYQFQGDTGPYLKCRRCRHEWTHPVKPSKGSGVIAPPSYLRQIARGLIK